MGGPLVFSCLQVPCGAAEVHPHALACSRRRPSRTGTSMFAGPSACLGSEAGHCHSTLPLSAGALQGGTVCTCQLAQERKLVSNASYCEPEATPTHLWCTGALRRVMARTCTRSAPSICTGGTLPRRGTPPCTRMPAAASRTAPTPTPPTRYPCLPVLMHMDSDLPGPAEVASQQVVSKLDSMICTRLSGRTRHADRLA